MSEIYTQQQRILNLLRGGNWYSARDLSRATEVLCYTKRISELRKAGHNIEIRWAGREQVGGRRHSEYRLVENG